MCRRGGVVSVEGRFHGCDEVWRGCGVERKRQLAVFEKACGGEVLTADDEFGVVGEQDFLVHVQPRLGIWEQVHRAASG
jgi:hypothetical protein